MRIISQNGKYDVPYDLCSFSCEHANGKESVICLNVTFDREKIFAKYSSEEKLKKVIEDMRTAYAKGEVKIFQFPEDS